ncbi:leucine-rich repeat protein 1-like [Condylostylus longicornis]|uniref:leucine-rich repeat protein 1-like n=1 Tax=Condylostylus longicornis TaxID=2530218 RepID=UPI00244DB7B8|nr:leucine-rich repeat protein 1-like [Condylostylus longicornis]
MKIPCETQIINRQLPNSLSNKYVKSTLAVGFHPPRKEDGQLFIMLFTPQHKNGIRYKVKDNINKIFTKFINDGKATISFKVPEHYILINCNPIQLKSFLATLKLGLEGKTEFNAIGLSTLATTSVPQKSHPVKKFTILKKSEFPIHGIPKTVEILTISGINRPKVDSQILFLKNLTNLNLSENSISKIPKELGKLKLTELDLSNNNLGENESLKDWEWITNGNILSSLRSLNLSKNKLSYFPYNIVKLKNLITLKLNENNIRKLPFAIRRLNNLKFLHLCSNKLESLPNSLNYIHLDTLDVWNNNFLSQPVDVQIISKAKGCIPPLWEMVARVVESKSLRYNSGTVPSILVDIMSESPLCPCGLLSFSSQIYERSAVITLDHVKHLVFSREQLIYQDCAACSDKCASKLYSNNMI